MDDLPKMKYLERAVKESMRLYPPVPFISRSLHEKVTLSKFPYCIYVCKTRNYLLYIKEFLRNT